MKPELKSQLLLGITRSKAKMLEYGVPEEHHISITQDPAKLFTISIGLLGDLAAAINREEADPSTLKELRGSLLFAARFFDSYLQSELNESLDPYIVLLGSASYYLCDLPGSASVLAKRIDGDCPDLDADGLESLLLRLLQTNPNAYENEAGGPFSEFIDGLSKSVLQFFEDGTGEDNLLDLATKLRETAYEFGTPRQLLFADIIAAVLRKKLENSTWKTLPSYSGLSRDKWLYALQKESFIKELWPAQHLLGKANVLKGESAIVQMPTSAGKTKAVELILRSAFLSDRTDVAIICAPFRALCHEIKNSLVESFHNESVVIDELSDAMQMDIIPDIKVDAPAIPNNILEALLANFDVSDYQWNKQILVITPEKLLYVLRHVPELATHVGLLVFDEGHQFDNGIRGITYELLLTSLRSMIPVDAQKVLISAVISNAEAIGGWLNGESNVVEGTALIPTFRSVGFASWLDQLGRIEYVNSRDVEQNEFFVPRVIERFNLGKGPGEKSDRFFPEQALKPNGKPNPDFGKTVALYLGLKLVPNGSIAIFCGRKATAASICEKVVDIIKRGSPLALPLGFSDAQEIERLKNLHIENLGADTPAAQSAGQGIFSHHGNTPHGIRLAVEHAMRDNLVRFVVCTSTLAQGVNLPIRYLIVTSVYQGIERIKVRDFHNLIGRAGRAGMHTEGSILFADPVVYDKRKARNDKWRWAQVKELLEPNNSEPCISNLLSIFDPIKSDDDKYTITMEALDFAKAYVNDRDEIFQLAEGIAARHGDKGFSRDGVERQVTWRIGLICAIESFLLSHWDDTETGLSETDVTLLAEGTLAFFLADEQKKEHIRELFQLLATSISEHKIDPVSRKIYGRTLYGLQEALAIERWVQSSSDGLFSTTDEAELLDFIWPLFIKHITSGIFTKLDKPEVLKEIAHGWIRGCPFSELLEIIRQNNAKMIWGTRKRELKIDHVVEICEGALAYSGALLIGAVCEFIETLDQDGTGALINRLQLFQKCLKYGLPTETTIALYELGFSDRVISQDIAESLSLSATQKRVLVKVLKQTNGRASAMMEKYPRYFQARMNELLQ